MANCKCVDIFYDYFKGNCEDEISSQLKDMSRSELAQLVLENIEGENTEKALMCRIYAVGMKGTKFNNEIIELTNLYLTLYPEGDDLVTVLSRLAKAYISEYEIEKALEVCEMLKIQDYDYIHSLYAECLYKLNRLGEAVKFLEERLVVVKEKGGQEPNEKQQKLIDSVAKWLEKYKGYIEKGKVYIPTTEKGREKLGIEAATRKGKTNSKYTLEALADTDTFVVFDFETTGFSALWKEIIEMNRMLENSIKEGLVNKSKTVLSAVIIF